MVTTRILFVHYGDEWIRGSEQCLIDLVDGLDRTRFEPVVWCNGRLLAEHLAAKGYDARQYRFDLLFNWNLDLSNLRPYFRMIGDAKRLLRAARIDLVHCNSGGPAQWMIPACRSLRLPMLTHVHCAYSRRERYLLGLHQSPFLAGVSASTLTDFLADGYPADCTRVVYNGVDLRRIAGGPSTDARRVLGLEPGAVVIASVGSLVEHKGHDVVVRALHLARRNAPASKLVGIIVGDGPERSALERLVGELDVDVRFLGYRRDVGAILRDATDILALASRREALGLVLLEAAHFSVPAVATAVGGIPEIVLDRQTGLLVPPDDPAAMAAAIVELATDAQMRDRLGATARQRMMQNFTADRMVAGFQDIYGQLLARERRSWGWLGRWNPWVPYARMFRRGPSGAPAAGHRSHGP